MQRVVLGSVAAIVVVVTSYTLVEHLRKRSSAAIEKAVEPWKTPQRVANDPQGPKWFAEVRAETGIDFVHVSGNSPEKPFPSANGSGVAAIDFDQDGNWDLYFATGTRFPLDPNQGESINRIYRNLGDWHFEDVTALTGLGHNGYSAGLTVGDYDSDGFPDVYVTCFGPNCLYRNQGDGTFERVERAARVDDPRWATSAAFLSTLR